MHSYTPSPHRPYLNPGTLPKGTIGKWYASSSSPGYISANSGQVSPRNGDDSTGYSSHLNGTRHYLTEPGFGISNYYMSTPPQRVAFDPAEEERLRRNKELMDAYGDKETIQDIERALSLYELQ